MRVSRGAKGKKYALAQQRASASGHFDQNRRPTVAQCLTARFAKNAFEMHFNKGRYPLVVLAVSDGLRLTFL